MILTQDQGETDTTTVVDFTVMVWYTPQFRATFWSPEDMMVFIDLIFAEANQGFMNSNIPVRFPLCVPYQYFSASLLIIDKSCEVQCEATSNPK